MSTEIKVPELGESITEGTIASWIKQEGDQVSRGDVLAELETDKVNLEISAEEDGVLSQIVKQPGDTVEIGEVIGLIEQGGSAAAKPADQKQEEQPKQQPVETKEAKPETPSQPKQEVPANLVATPAARKWAREHGKDLSAVATNDPVGRIHKEDVQRPQQEKPAAPVDKKPTGNQDGRPAERIPMTRRRQTIAKRLVQAQHEAAMLTTFNEVDMTAIMNLRKRRNPDFEKTHGIKIGFMSFFTKAVVGALKSFPLLNAEIDGDELVVKSYYDIGIAVSAKEGLVVPNLRNADRLSFAGIEHEIKNLAEKARENKLKLDELQGGTFTITNGGIFGSMLSTPILNPPQVGILGMHNIQLRPVAIDEERMENRPMMYIALSYDHRIVDGRDAVQFLVRVKNLLEDPESLLLEG